MPAARPMLIAVIDHDVAHPITDPTNPAYLSTWLAFNPTTRKVLVEVEATTPQGLQKFRDDYAGHFTTQPTHALAGDPREWRLLIGESAFGLPDAEADPQKIVRRREALARRAEQDERERKDRLARQQPRG